jgi:hypothetical protein
VPRGSGARSLAWAYCFPVLLVPRVEGAYRDRPAPTDRTSLPVVGTQLWAAGSTSPGPLAITDAVRVAWSTRRGCAAPSSLFEASGGAPSEDGHVLLRGRIGEVQCVRRTRSDAVARAFAANNDGTAPGTRGTFRRLSLPRSSRPEASLSPRTLRARPLRRVRCTFTTIKQPTPHRSAGSPIRSEATPSELRLTERCRVLRPGSMGELDNGDSSKAGHLLP